MSDIHETLGTTAVVTPELAALLAAQMHDAAQRMLVYHCETCTGTFAEGTYSTRP